MSTDTKIALHLLLVQLLATCCALLWEMMHDYFNVGRPHRVSIGLPLHYFKHATKGEVVFAGTAIIAFSFTLPFFSQALLHLPNFTTLAIVLVSII
jgi:hypothetical protein